MRLPSSARFTAVLVFTCTSIVLCLTAPGAFARSGAAADELEQVEAKLAACKQDLARGRTAVNDAEDFRALARRQPFVFLMVPGVGPVPMPVRAATDAVILEHLTGGITRAEMVKRLQNLVKRAQRTVQALQAVIEDSREGLDQTEKRCAALAEQRARLRAGGGQPPGNGGSGAYPGGTATTMTLTIEGHTGKLNLKTGEITYAGKNTDVPGTRRFSVSGSVQLDGTLPAGWNIYVHAEAKTAHTGKGAFTIKDPIGSQRRVGATAQICASPPVPNQPCFTGNGKAGVTVYWTWVP